MKPRLVVSFGILAGVGVLLMESGFVVLGAVMATIAGVGTLVVGGKAAWDGFNNKIRVFRIRIHQNLELLEKHTKTAILAEPSAQQVIYVAVRPRRGMTISWANPAFFTRSRMPFRCGDKALETEVHITKVEHQELDKPLDAANFHLANRHGQSDVWDLMLSLTPNACIVLRLTFDCPTEWSGVLSLQLGIGKGSTIALDERSVRIPLFVATRQRCMPPGLWPRTILGHVLMLTQGHDG